MFSCLIQSSLVKVSEWFQAEGSQSPYLLSGRHRSHYNFMRLKVIFGNYFVVEGRPLLVVSGKELKGFQEQLYEPLAFDFISLSPHLVTSAEVALNFWFLPT